MSEISLDEVAAFANDLKAELLRGPITAVMVEVADGLTSMVAAGEIVEERLTEFADRFRREVAQGPSSMPLEALAGRLDGVAGVTPVAATPSSTAPTQVTPASTQDPVLANPGAVAPPPLPTEAPPAATPAADAPAASEDSAPSDAGAAAQAAPTSEPVTAASETRNDGTVATATTPPGAVAVTEGVAPVTGDVSSPSPTVETGGVA